MRRDRMFNLGPDLRLGAVLRTLALVHHAAVTIAALMKSRAFGVCAGSPPAGSDRPVALSATLADVTNAAWINCCSYRVRNAPSGRNTTGCPSRALAAFLVEEGAIVSTIVLVVNFSP